MFSVPSQYKEELKKYLDSGVYRATHVPQTEAEGLFSDVGAFEVRIDSFDTKLLCTMRVLEDKLKFERPVKKAGGSTPEPENARAETNEAGEYEELYPRLKEVTGRMDTYENRIDRMTLFLAKTRKYKPTTGRKVFANDEEEAAESEGKKLRARYHLLKERLIHDKKRLTEIRAFVNVDLKSMGFKGFSD